MKKGFTLIELLAVMAILGVISLITLPVVSNVLNQTKINNYRNSIYGLLRAVEADHTENGVTTNVYTIKNGVIEPDIDFSGKVDGSGTIEYNADEKTTIKIGNDELCATKAPNKKQITVTKGKCK